MHVQHKLSRWVRFRAHLREGVDVKLMEVRIDADAISVLGQIIKPYRFAVCLNQVYLGVGYA
jgi:hypothetical protein